MRRNVRKEEGRDLLQYTPWSHVWKINHSESASELVSVVLWKYAIGTGVDLRDRTVSLAPSTLTPLL
jgi:hypothetical protein